MIHTRETFIKELENLREIKSRKNLTGYGAEKLNNYEELENLILFGVGVELPTEEEMLSNLEFKVKNWLQENTKDEITGFKVGFKTCYRWLKNKVKVNGN